MAIVNALVALAGFALYLGMTSSYIARVQRLTVLIRIDDNTHEIWLFIPFRLWDVCPSSSAIRVDGEQFRAPLPTCDKCCVGLCSHQCCE